MERKGIRRMLLGEEMPDKDDPKYRERYEREVGAGRRFAKRLRIDKAAARVQRFADSHRTAFLSLVFGFVALALAFNIYRLATVACRQPQRTATEVQDSVLQSRHHNITKQVKRHEDNRQD